MRRIALFLVFASAFGLLQARAITGVLTTPGFYANAQWDTPTAHFEVDLFRGAAVGADSQARTPAQPYVYALVWSIDKVTGSYDSGWGLWDESDPALRSARVYGTTTMSDGRSVTVDFTWTAVGVPGQRIPDPYQWNGDGVAVYVQPIVAQPATFSGTSTDVRWPTTAPQTSYIGYGTGVFAYSYETKGSAIVWAGYLADATWNDPQLSVNIHIFSGILAGAGSGASNVANATPTSYACANVYDKVKFRSDFVCGFEYEFDPLLRSAHLHGSKAAVHGLITLDYTWNVNGDPGSWVNQPYVSQGGGNFDAAYTQFGAHRKASVSGSGSSGIGWPTTAPQSAAAGYITQQGVFAQP